MRVKSWSSVAWFCVLAVLAASAPLAASAAQEPGTPPLQQSNVDATRVLVIDRLVSLGLTQQEAGSRVSKLTNEDLAQLAAHPEHVAMGGVKDRTLIIIAVVLVIPSILLLLLI